MYVIKCFFVYLGCYVLLISNVLTETLQNFLSFCHFSFEGGGGRGVKKETKGIKYFIRHRLFDVNKTGMLLIFY